MGKWSGRVPVRHLSSRPQASSQNVHHSVKGSYISTAPCFYEERGSNKRRLEASSAQGASQSPQQPHPYACFVLFA